MDAYGLWGLVVINSIVFIGFAFSFFRPRTRRDWRTFGLFAAFVAALFAEMYGFPLTIYLLSGWLQSRFPETDLLSHENGHLWYSLLGRGGNPHLNPIHVFSYLFLLLGFTLLSTAWKALYSAHKSGCLATTGPYAHVRHPQYVAFVIIMFGFLVQWPTFLTLIMFPVLVLMYARLARGEERHMMIRFGDEYEAYRNTTSAFVPRLNRDRLDKDRQSDDRSHPWAGDT